MGTYSIKVYPSDPAYMPNHEQILAATAILLRVPTCDSVWSGISIEMWPHINLVLGMQMFQEIHCPLCGTSLDFNWWNDAARSQRPWTSYDSMALVTPRCRQPSNFNDLDYQHGAGFARFSMEISNPFDYDLDSDTLQRLSDAIGCGMRTVWCKV
jgi:hypothetical protein